MQLFVDITSGTWHAPFGPSTSVGISWRTPIKHRDKVRQIAENIGSKYSYDVTSVTPIVYVLSSQSSQAVTVMEPRGGNN